MKSLAVALLFVAVAASGRHRGDVKVTYTENGLTREATLDLKLEGDRLSGALASDRGKAQIELVNSAGTKFRSVSPRGNGDEITVKFGARSRARR